MSESVIKKEWTIYKITNPLGRVYIGATINLRKRLNSYRKGHSDSQRLIHRSIFKYGFENHSVDVIDVFYGDLSLANSKEIFWVRTYMSFYSRWPKNKGLNLTMGGSGQIGRKHNKKQIESNKIHGERLHTPEMRKKRAVGQIGKKMPPSFAVKISKSHKGHTWMRGVIYSKEARERLSKMQRKIHGLKIAQYDINRTLIACYDSVQDAVENSGISRWRIRDSIHKRKVCDGSIFVLNSDELSILADYK